MDFLHRWEEKSISERRSVFGLGDQKYVADPGGDVEVTATQSAVLNIEAEALLLSPYTISTAYDISGEVDAKLLVKSVEDTLSAHPVLNTAYFELGEVAVSRLIAVRAVEILGTSKLDETLKQIASEPIDTSFGPCTSVWVFQDEQARPMCLLIKTHHVVADGQSLSLVIEEIRDRYNGLIPDPSDQFRGLVSQGLIETGQDISEESAGWWRRHIGSAQSAHFSSDLPTSNASRFRGGHEVFSVERKAWDRATHFAAERSGASSSVGLLAVAAVCGRYSGEWDSIFGLSVSGRATAGLATMVGPFADSVPVRIELDPHEQASAVLARLAAGLSGGIIEHEVPFSSLVRALSPRRQPGLNPLYNVLVTMEAGPQPSLTLDGGAQMQPRPIMNHTARVPFQLTIGELSEGGAIFRIDYSTSMFSKTFVRRIGGDLVKAISDMTEGVAIGDLGRREEGSHIAGRELDIVTDVSDLLERSVSLLNDRIAVVKGSQTVTYRELAVRALSVREQLLDMDATVALVAANHGPDLVAALVACLSARVAYVPVSGTLVEQRVEAIRAKIGADVRIDSSEHGLVVTRVGSGKSDAHVPADSDRAYAMFTSGSTGEPKAVWVGRSALAHHRASAASAGFIRPGERILALTNPTFDISIEELLLPLIEGATIVCPSNGSGLSGISDAVAMINAELVDVVHGTPSMMQALIADGWHSRVRVKRIIVGGERLGRSLVQELQERSDDVRNVYGPTEATIWATEHRIVDSKEDPPIGRPLPGYKTRLVSRGRGSGVSPCEVGRILISGPGLADGYGGQPEATAEKFFILDGERWYDTGDFGKLVNEEIVYLGRADAQIKIRGHRVELGEYESIAEGLDGVRGAAAACDGESVYVLVRGEVSYPNLVAAFSRMPSTIRPGAYATTKAPLPLTSSGKLDRRAAMSLVKETMRAVDANQQAEPGPDEEAAELEEWVLELWDRLLRRRVTRDANIFDEGGHSLILARTVSAAKVDLGISLKMSDLYSEPTAQGIASQLRQVAMRTLAPDEHA